MKTHLFALLAISLAYTSTNSFAANKASQEASLDAPYKRLAHPRVDRAGRDGREAAPKSDTVAVIEKMSEVKSQAARGSCSIFSAVALLEGMLAIEGKADNKLDLSEEYLQYLIAQHATNDGSSSPANFRALHEFGVPSEEKLPYIGATWKSLNDGSAQERCANVQGRQQANCLTGHRDPALLLMDDKLLAATDADFAAARAEAQANKARFFTDKGEEESGIIFGTGEVKELLAKGQPLTLDIDFYYGAWNHRLADELTIGRDTENWAQGIVSYPERNSLDAEKSHDKPAGHSVVLVGYDDEREIEYTMKMKNGRMKKFKRKGVYYFKNSWGTGNFGTQTEIDGKVFAGYGVISQDYANEYGQFFKLAL